jgi:hypothetical protein
MNAMRILQIVHISILIRFCLQRKDIKGGT